MCGLHLDIRVTNANQVRNKLFFNQKVRICQRAPKCAWKLTFSISQSLQDIIRQTLNVLNIF